MNRVRKSPAVVGPDTNQEWFKTPASITQNKFKKSSLRCFSRAYNQAFNALYGTPKPARFNADALPDPERYYNEHLGELRANAKGWASARCPFHDDRSPSLSVNLKHGGFHCFSCGAKGGDVLDFERRLKGCSFLVAARSLGAWGQS